MIRFGDFLKVSTMSVALLSGTALAVAVVMPDAAYAGKGNGNGNSGNGNGNGGSSGKGNSGGNGVSGGESSAKGKAVGNGNGSSRGKSVASRDPIRAIGNLLRGKSGDAKTTRTSRSSSDGAAKTRKSASSGSNKKAATSRAPKVASAPAAKPRGNPLARELGVHPSELGALNAAHASPTALENASPNSRVGKIANYMNEVGETRELEIDLEEAKTKLDSLEEPTRSKEEIDAAIGTAEDEKAGLQSDLAELQKKLEEAGGSDADLENEINGVTDAITAKDNEISELEQERADGAAYAAAEEDVQRLEGELETQEADQRMALEDAANKPVTDEVESAVQKLLGIYGEPEAEEEASEEDVTLILEDEPVVVE